MNEVIKELEENLDKYARPIIQKITEGKLNLIRSISFAGAGLAVASIIAISTIASMTLLLEIVACFFAISLPLFLMMALVSENHIWAGSKYHEHYREVMFKPKMVFASLTAYISIAIAVLLVIFNLSLYSGVICSVISAFAYKTSSSLQLLLAEHIKDSSKKGGVK